VAEVLKKFNEMDFPEQKPETPHQPEVKLSKPFPSSLTLSVCAWQAFPINCGIHIGMRYLVWYEAN
jgi:hypothetical protein